MTNPSIRRYFPLDRPRLILWINICRCTMNILSNRSLTYRGEQILWCFLRMWRANISVLSQVRILYVMKRKTVQTKYDVPVRRAFRWDSKNFVKQSFTKFLESQLYDSRRKLYLSAPFFFYLRYGWLVRGRLYMPNYAVNCTTESAIYVMELWLILISAARNLDWRISQT